MSTTENTSETKSEAYIGVQIVLFTDTTHASASTKEVYSTKEEAVKHARKLEIFNPKPPILVAFYAIAYPSGTVEEINAKSALNQATAESKLEIIHMMESLDIDKSLMLKTDDISDVHDFEVPFTITGSINVPATDADSALEQAKHLSDNFLRPAVDTAIQNSGYGMDTATRADIV